ncbi:hypothetical protein [Parvibaculum sp.]|uniref:hypothetical protein n=1 Tax=Parvibaculum sp. TaxID=2024848 RepID=UPI00391A2E2F
MTGSSDTTTTNDKALLGAMLLGIDTARAGRIVSWLLALVCVLLAAVDFIWPLHGYFEIEEQPVFYGWFGFLVCIALAIFAKFLGLFLKRREDYYGPLSVTSEEHPASDLARETADA